MMKTTFILALLGLILTGCNNKKASTEEAENAQFQQDEVIETVHEYIDLGLPSGTLWATMNVGASTPEQRGDYFSWGETKPKKEYSWNTYKYSIRDNSKFFHENQQTKYCTQEDEGTVDHKAELEPTDDAATTNWGSEWRMPSREQWKELCDRCEWKKTTLPDRSSTDRSQQW